MIKIKSKAIVMLFLFLGCYNQPQKTENSSEKLIDMGVSKKLLYGSLLPLCPGYLDEVNYVRIAFVAKYDTNFCYYATKEHIGNPVGLFKFVFIREKSFSQKSETKTTSVYGTADKEIDRLWQYFYNTARKKTSWGDSLRYNLGTYDYAVLESKNKDGSINTKIVDVLPKEYLEFKKMRRQLDSLLQQYSVMIF